MGFGIDGSSARIADFFEEGCPKGPTRGGSPGRGGAVMGALATLAIWRRRNVLAALVASVVLSCTGAAQATSEGGCAGFYRASDAPNAFYGTSIVPARDFQDHRILKIIQSCIHLYNLSEKELVFLVLGTSVWDALSIYDVDKPEYKYVDQWKNDAIASPKPRDIAVFVAVRGVGVLRIVTSGRISEKQIYIGVDTTHDSLLYRMLVNSIRQISLSVHSNEKTILGGYFHQGPLADVTLYVSDPSAVERAEQILGTLRLAVTGGEMSVYLSSAPCFRTAQSFPYLDLSQSAGGRCITDPSYGEDVVICVASPSSNERFCMKLQPLLRRK